MTAGARKPAASMSAITRPSMVRSMWARVQTAEGKTVRYTAKGSNVYAICLTWPGQELVLKEPKASSSTRVTLLGRDEPLQSSAADGQLRIQIPALSVDEMPCRDAYVFKLT